MPFLNGRSDHVLEVLIEALNHAGEPLFIFRRSGELVFVSDSFLELLGFSVSDPPANVNSFWTTYNDNQLFDHELTAEFHDVHQDLLCVKLSCAGILDEYCLARILSCWSDHDALSSFHSQRLETLGLLAGGIAHDFNNVLTGILGHITYLKTILAPEGPHVESLNAIEEGARKASGMTQQILGFSRQDLTEQPKAIALGDLVERTCKLLRGALSPAIRFEWEVSGDDLRVVGVEGRFSQVIANLVVNARDAVGKDGYIKVEVAPVGDEEQLSARNGSFDLTRVPFARLSVFDNGEGIPETVLGRVLEPYFSTKQENGTGLGLATVDAIARAYGGIVDIVSEVGTGSKVSVFLPVGEADRFDRNAGIDGDLTDTMQGGTERLLVVDDESPVRNVLSVSLAHLGYRVEIAESGAEAIEKYSQDPTGFDLVILDMLMPKLPGNEVFYKLKEIDDQVRVLLISGYTSEDAVNDVLKKGGRDFIQKPFTIEELARKVRECLDGDPVAKSASVESASLNS